MMIRALWTGATGMHAMQTDIDTIANDLTNVNTPGYKQRLVNFQDLFYQNLRASGLQGGGEGENVPVGIQVGNGVRVTSITPVFTKGSAESTGVWSDVMFGDATSFLSVTLDDGTLAYTRDGTLRINSNGDLRTSDGYALNPPITGIPTGATDPSITPAGNVQYVDTDGNTQTVGRLQLYNFINPAGLSALGSNLWKETESSGQATAGYPGDAGFGTLTSTYVEGSNVDAVTAMVNLITAQRSYEFNSRTITTADEMLQTVNQLKS